MDSPADSQELELHYVARNPCCGKMIAASCGAADHPKETAKDVASWIRRGLAVDRVPIEAIRDTNNWCKCGRAKK